MNFQRKIGTQYSHFLCEDNIILGVPKELDEEEAELLLKNPMQCGSIVTKIVTANISPVQRANTLDALEMYCKEKREEKVLNPYYWNIVLDFIFALYGKTLFDLSKDLTEVYRDYSEKNIFDTLDKIKDSQGNPRKDTNKWIKLILAYCRISEDILRTGKGYLYVINDVKKYSLKSVKQYIEKYEQYDLSHMICEVTGIAERDVVKVPLEIVCDDNMVSKDIEKFIVKLIDSMARSRE